MGTPTRPHAPTSYVASSSQEARFADPDADLPYTATMPGDRREQVFVSSTYLDLREERQSVIQALLIAGCIPAGMELFPAGNEQKWRLIQRVISECDYYVLVIGGKYGSVDPATDLSYTEMEYDFAEASGKPIMAFLHGEPGQLRGDQLELDAERREKLDAFRAKIESGRIVRYWTTPAELPGHVALSLMETREQNPAEGWVRASRAMTPEQQAEVAELRARVAELTQEAAFKQNTVDDVEDLAQGEDEYEVEIKATGYKTQDLDRGGQALRYDSPQYVWTLAIPITWNGILQGIGPILLHEASEPEISRAFEAFVRQEWSDRPKLHPKDLKRQIGSIGVSATAAQDVIVQFFALGIIARGVKKRTVSDKGKYWALTGRGEDQMMKLRAIRRSEDE